MITEIKRKTKAKLWPHLEGLRTKLLLTTFYVFARQLKNVITRILKSEKKQKTSSRTLESRYNSIKIFNVWANTNKLTVWLTARNSKRRDDTKELKQLSKEIWRRDVWPLHTRSLVYHTERPLLLNWINYNCDSWRAVAKFCSQNLGQSVF